MSWIQRLWLRLQTLFSRRRVVKQLDEEIQFHLDQQAAEYVAAGMDREEARHAAMRSFGNPTLLKEQTIETWGWARLDEIGQDLRLAFRGMRRDAGSTVFAILIAGIGIGASSTVFSVVNALLLRPLPFRDPGRLVWIVNQEWGMQVDQYRDLRARNHSFSDLAAFAGVHVGASTLTGAGEPERLTNTPVTCNFFPLLGVQPAIGRSFAADECQGKVNSPPVALLSYGLWQRRFASDPAVVGRTLTVNKEPVTVVGVLPASFDFTSIFEPGTPVDLFIPWPLTAETNRFGNTMKAIGRLRPGATAQNAQTEFTLLAEQLKIEHPVPERNPVVPRLTPLKGHVSGRFGLAVLVLACAVGAVMLIVCANLSNLQLARLGARQKEMAMRAALGAGRSRLLRQMLTESVALSCSGAALGVILAVLGTRAIAHLDAFDIPLLSSVRLDGEAVIFTVAAAVLTGVLFGLLPAVQVRSFAVGEALKEGSRGSSGRSHAWARNGLVVSEIAFACTLLVGAGLLIRSFLRVLDLKLGFEPERVASMRVDPSLRFSGLTQVSSYIDEVLRRASSLPGIRTVGLTDVLPFGGDRSWQVSGKGQIFPKGQYPPEPFIRVVSEGYLESLGIRLESGRGFTEGDRVGSEPVAIVNETLARTLWPGQEAVGQFVTQDGGRRVVGVVADVRHMSPEQPGGPEMYIPMRQTGDYAAMNLVVRTAIPPEALATAVRSALRPIDPNLPVGEFKTLQNLVDKAVSPRRFLAVLLAGFAGFSLLLASMGIYAVISYSVNQRKREIGICMALGASERFVKREVLTRTLRLALTGVALGTLASFFLTKGITSLLFDTTPTDPAAFSGVILLLCAVALVAGYVPARRASRVDPMIALKAN